MNVRTPEKRHDDSFAGSKKQSVLGAYPLIFAIASFLVLFSSSAFRHQHFQSEAFDLGIFDQALWLISVGHSPQSSLIGMHILGDHAAWLLYPISILYRIYPSVYWLFLLQAGALATGVILTHAIAIRSGLTRQTAVTLAVVYILHPLAFNVNLYDFHLDVLLGPLLLLAYWACLSAQPLIFAIAIFLAFGTKEVAGLAVVALGVYLFLSRRDRRYAGVACLLGLLSFVVSCKLLIPHFSSHALPSGYDRYQYLGHSFAEVVGNLLTPSGLIEALHPTESAKYVFCLLLPVWFAVSPKNLWPLVGISPILLLNLISSLPLQRTWLFQHSIVFLPFLVLVSVNAIQKNQYFCLRHGTIRSLAVLIFVAPIAYHWAKGEFDYPHPFWRRPTEVQAMSSALDLIPASARVLAPSHLLAHLSQRIGISFIRADRSKDRLSDYSFVLLDLNQAGFANTRENSMRIREILDSSVIFGRASKLVDAEGVLLYRLG